MLIALTGKPSVGKSTFFKAATLAEVEIAPHPFTTIKATEGIAFVKIKCVDEDFNLQCKPKFGYCINNYRFIPIRLMDVPGLIEGSHKGLGLGNQFLNDLSQADALIEIIDISGSTNAKGEAVEPGSYDPRNDILMLENEIDMWLLNLLKKDWSRFIRQVKQENKNFVKEIAEKFSGLKITEGLVKEALKELKLNEDPTKWNENELKLFALTLRKKSKPLIIACNKIDIKGAEENYNKLKKEFKDYILMPCSAESELALREAAKHNLISYIPGENNFKILKENALNEKQKNALNFIKKNVLEKYNSTGVQEVLDKTIFELLNYFTVYPVENENKLTDSQNNILPDVHLLPENSTTLDLAFKIHTDIGNKFTAAIDIKTKRRLGKDQILKNKDVIKILTK